MKILVIGAGVIGATYAWQLADAGNDVTLLVREGKKARCEREGISIRYTDERTKPKTHGEVVYHPKVVESFTPPDDYELIVVAVKSNQLDPLLPMLAENAGNADILFFQNNWWGDEKIKACLPPSRYLFGFSRLVGGWKNDSRIDCVIFNGVGQATMLGERDGRPTPRLANIKAVFDAARMKPEISSDILGWLMTHYVEYLGAVGGILKAGSAAEFSASTDLVRDAILATREGLEVCRARGVRVSHAAPLNLRMFSLPLWLIVPLGKMQYGARNIQQFFEENIAHGMDEITAQYHDVLDEAHRLGVAIPHLEALEPYYEESSQQWAVSFTAPY